MEVASALKNITKMFVFTLNFCLHNISREDIVFLKPCGNNDFPTIFISTNNRDNNTKYTTDNHKTQQGKVNGMMSDHTIYHGLIIFDTNN
jgi:hypothetical protein